MIVLETINYMGIVYQPQKAEMFTVLLQRKDNSMIKETFMSSEKTELS